MHSVFSILMIISASQREPCTMFVTRSDERRVVSIAQSVYESVSELDSFVVSFVMFSQD